VRSENKKKLFLVSLAFPFFFSEREHKEKMNITKLDTTMQNGTTPGTVSYPDYFTGGGIPGLSGVTTIPVTENPSPSTEQPVTAPLMISALKDKSHLQYAPSDILFCYKTKDDLGSHRYATFSIWNLNFGFDQGFRWRSSDQGIKKGVKRTFNDAANYMSLFPLTMEEFNDNWIYAGVLLNDSPNNKSTLRMFTVAYQGRVSIPNIWGDVHIGKKKLGFFFRFFKKKLQILF